MHTGVPLRPHPTLPPAVAGGGLLTRWQDADYLFSSDAAHPDTRRLALTPLSATPSGQHMPGKRPTRGSPSPLLTDGVLEGLCWFAESKRQWRSMLVNADVPQWRGWCCVAAATAFCGRTEQGRS